MMVVGPWRCSRAGSVRTSRLPRTSERWRTKAGTTRTTRRDAWRWRSGSFVRRGSNWCCFVIFSLHAIAAIACKLERKCTRVNAALEQILEGGKKRVQSTQTAGRPRKQLSLHQVIGGLVGRSDERIGRLCPEPGRMRCRRLRVYIISPMRPPGGLWATD